MDVKSYLTYPAIFKKEANGLYDVAVKYKGGEWHTCGSNYEEAYKMAQDLIIDASIFNFGDNLEMPESAIAQKTDTIINIGLDSALKIMLRNALVKSKVKNCDLAKQLKISPPALAQYMRYGKSSKLEILAEAFKILGYPLNITCAN